MALHMKGVSYEYIEQDVIDKGELLLKYNPVYKKVPVLIHNGVPLCESQIIVQYIDEVWAGSEGSAILPADPYDRATARFWAAYVDDKVRVCVYFLTLFSSSSEL
jgi:glutathione S-transferase